MAKNKTTETKNSVSTSIGAIKDHAKRKDCNELIEMLTKRKNSMKTLLTICLVFFCTASVYADCAGTGLWVFPNEQTIKQNSIFVLDGYAESQHIVLGLNKKYPIYLKYGNNKVKLLVTETHVGQFYLTQAILKPETQLQAGIVYTMCIDSLPEYESFKHYNNLTEQYEPIKYTVVAGADLAKPVVTAKPHEIEKSYKQYGCGPAMYVNFNFPVKDSSAVIVKTKVKNIKSGTETIYYIVPHNNQIQVGHGMCSGAFTYDDGKQYEVEFSFMDASGNLTASTGNPIAFTKPTDETWNNWKKKN